MIIKINNLILSGVHGLTEKEKNKSQNFRIDAEVITRNNKNIDDNIEATLDYRKIKNDIREIIEGEPCMLLETICEKITEKIFLNEKISSVKVEVAKIDIWDSGFPSVVAVRERKIGRARLLES